MQNTIATLSRLPDWDRRLARVTEKHLRLSGEWGVSDCLMTVADAIEAVTGSNPYASYAGRYKTETGAARLMRKNGCDDVEAVLARFFPPIGRLLARRGDVGVIAVDGILAAGYVTEHGFATKGQSGLIFHRQTDLKAAFKVG